MEHPIFGFIGCGNMGGALARAACAGPAGPGQVLLADHSKAQTLAQELGCTACTNEEAARQSDFLFLGVKPQMMRDMLAQLRPVLAQRAGQLVLVSMAAGLTVATIREMTGGDYPVIRIMPNTPVQVGEGMVQYTAQDVSDAQLRDFLQAMEKAGRFDLLAEHLIDAGSAVSGCGPAYVCLFAEALADGGVACGLPRDKALEYAAQTLAGTARLILESGKHPGQLKDAVCSPGGSTIQGVRELEAGGLRSTVMEAVLAAFEKNRELGKQ